MRVSVFSITSDGNVIRSNKYLPKFARTTRRHECKVSVTVVWC